MPALAKELKEAAQIEPEVTSPKADSGVTMIVITPAAAPGMK
jgi:hypothetical protein